MPICNLINVPRTTKWVMHDIPHIFTEKWHAKFPSHHLKKGVAGLGRCGAGGSNNYAYVTTKLGWLPVLETMPITGKNLNEIPEIEFFVDSNISFTIRILDWDLGWKE